MTPWRWAVLFLMGILLVPAQAATLVSEPVLDRLLQESSLPVVVSDLAALMPDLLVDKAEKLGAEKLAKLGAATAAAYRRDLLLEDIRVQLAGHLEADDAIVATDFYATRLGARLVQLDTATMAVTDRATEERRNLEDVPFSRLLLLRRLVKATGEAEVQADAVSTVHIALIAGIATFIPEGMLDVGKAKLDIVESRDDLAAALALDLTSSRAYVYRFLSDADLQRLLSFAESAAGRRYNDAVGQAVRHAMESAGQRFRREMRGERPLSA